MKDNGQFLYKIWLPTEYSSASIKVWTGHVAEDGTAGQSAGKAGEFLEILASSRQTQALLLEQEYHLCARSALSLRPDSVLLEHSWALQLQSALLNGTDHYKGERKGHF